MPHPELGPDNLSKDAEIQIWNRPSSEGAHGLDSNTPGFLVLHTWLVGTGEEGLSVGVRRLSSQRGSPGTAHPGGELEIFRNFLGLSLTTHT